jgi:hypothetical protein
MTDTAYIKSLEEEVEKLKKALEEKDHIIEGMERAKVIYEDDEDVDVPAKVYSDDVPIVSHRKKSKKVVDVDFDFDFELKKNKTVEIDKDADYL